MKTAKKRIERMYTKIREINGSMKIGWLGMGIYTLFMIIAMFNYPNYNQRQHCQRHAPLTAGVFS